MSTKLSKFIPIAMVFFLLGALVSPVLAQGEKPDDPITHNSSSQVRSDLGHLDPRFEVGKNGYKVFNIGAIASVNIKSSDDGNQAFSLLSTYRSGFSDAWLDYGVCGTVPCWYHYGWHESGSDLWEAEIWANGRLKVTTDSSWRATCTGSPTSGDQSSCGTNFSHLLPRTIRSETDHHFHTSGYVDDNFTTQDSA